MPYHAWSSLYSPSSILDLVESPVAMGAAQCQASDPVFNSSEHSLIQLSGDLASVINYIIGKTQGNSLGVPASTMFHVQTKQKGSPAESLGDRQRPLFQPRTNRNFMFRGARNMSRTPYSRFGCHQCEIRILRHGAFRLDIAFAECQRSTLRL